ncbi:MAG: response regulator [Nitrospirota bacterium]|nr:response regulator [Nitrospirota bacterium]
MIDTAHIHPIAPPSHLASGRIRILLVDDNEDDAMIAQDYLARVPGRTYHVDWASTFQTGITTLLAQQHDICLVDYCLDKGTGLDIVAAAVKADCPTPIIMISGTTDTTLREEALALGAAVFLFKSEVNSYGLECAIDRALAHT